MTNRQALTDEVLAAIKQVNGENSAMLEAFRAGKGATRRPFTIASMGIDHTDTLLREVRQLRSDLTTAQAQADSWLMANEELSGENVRLRQRCAELWERVEKAEGERNEAQALLAQAWKDVDKRVQEVGDLAAALEQQREQDARELAGQKECYQHLLESFKAEVADKNHLSRFVKVQEQAINETVAERQQAEERERRLEVVVAWSQGFVPYPLAAAFRALGLNDQGDGFLDYLDEVTARGRDTMARIKAALAKGKEGQG